MDLVYVKCLCAHGLLYRVGHRVGCPVRTKWTWYMLNVCVGCPVRTKWTWYMLNVCVRMAFCIE